jgi:hypothetical protein
MSKRFFMALPLLLVALGAAGVALSVFQTGRVPAQLNALVPPGFTSEQVALACHVVSALIAACAAMIAVPGRGGRFTLALLFSLMALTLPGVGLLTVAVMLVIFALRPVADVHPEDRWTVGVPRMVMGENARTPLQLEPLAGTLRRVSLTEQGPIILGLKNAVAEGRLPLLRRFQNDDDAQLQFFAQGVLGSAEEELETALRRYEGRLDQAKSLTGAAQSAAISDAATSAGEICLELARMAPPADVAGAQVQARAALTFSETAAEAHPQNQTAYWIATEALLLLKEPAKARQALAAGTKLGASAISKAPQGLLPHMVSHAEDRWDELATRMAAQPLEALAADSSLSEVAGYWVGNASPQALSRS